MIDPINAATDLTKKAAIDAAKGVANNAKGAAIAAATAAVPPVAAAAAEKLKKLPTTKDPELVKTQAKAEAQKLKGELESKLQQEKDKKIEELKDKASVLAPLVVPGIALFLKLPILDPKILATLAFLKAQQEFRELKQKASKENLKKAKENFTFPMKPPTSLGGIPKIPEVPKIPKLPTIPTSLPSLPNIPKL